MRVSEVIAAQQAAANSNTNRVIWEDVIFNAKVYGAKGDGVTDDIQAIRDVVAAAAAKKGVAYFPPGDYKISDTIEITTAVKIQGVDASVTGTRILINSDKPAFYVMAPCTIENLAIVGSNNASYTMQDGIFINNTNDVYVRNVFLVALYNGIHIKDTVFYTFFDNVRFYSAKNALMFGEGTSAGGYAIQINNCQCTIDESKYGFLFRNIGSIIIDSLLMSPGKCTEAGVIFESIAPLAGIQQISNSVFEACATNYGFRIIGTAAQPIKFVYFSNCYFAGEPAMAIDYGRSINFDNCYFTSGINGVRFQAPVRDISLVNCEFQTLDNPIASLGGSSIDVLNITNPTYEGGREFLYLPNVPNGSIDKVSIQGGRLGTNANPISVQLPFNIRVDVPGYNKLRNSGTKTFNGTGTSTQFLIEHGLSYTPSYVNALPASTDTGNAEIRDVWKDSTYIIVNLKTAPPLGTLNVNFFWDAKV